MKKILGVLLLGFMVSDLSALQITNSKDTAARISIDKSILNGIGIVYPRYKKPVQSGGGGTTYAFYDNFDTAATPTGLIDSTTGWASWGQGSSNNWGVITSALGTDLTKIFNNNTPRGIGNYDGSVTIISTTAINYTLQFDMYYAPGVCTPIYFIYLNDPSPVEVYAVNYVSPTYIWSIDFLNNNSNFYRYDEGFSHGFGGNITLAGRVTGWNTLKVIKTSSDINIFCNGTNIYGGAITPDVMLPSGYIIFQPASGDSKDLMNLDNVSITIP